MGPSCGGLHGLKGFDDTNIGRPRVPRTPPTRMLTGGRDGSGGGVRASSRAAQAILRCPPFLRPHQRRRAGWLRHSSQGDMQ